MAEAWDRLAVTYAAADDLPPLPPAAKKSSDPVPRRSAVRSDKGWRERNIHEERWSDKDKVKDKVKNLKKR